MKVDLKGINRKTKRLAGGRMVTYFWAWKGGPRIRDPNTPEGLADYMQAIADRQVTPTGTLLSVINLYQQSTKFTALSERSKSDYIEKIKVIEREFGDLPIEALKARKTHGVIVEWRDRLAAGTSGRQADYCVTVLNTILNWALKDRPDLIETNPAAGIERLYEADRVDRVWKVSDEEAFRAAAYPELRLAFDLAIWTAQRQGDLLKLSWSSYDGRDIRLRQSKSALRVCIPLPESLRAELDATPKRGTIILTNVRGVPWSADGFRSSWRKICQNARIKGLTFHDLRGTAVTRYAVAGCTQAEIMAITGHGRRGTLERYYLHMDYRLAVSAVRKREEYESRTDIPDCVPDRV